jgi:hypothetical protein
MSSDVVQQVRFPAARSGRMKNPVVIRPVSMDDGPAFVLATQQFDSRALRKLDEGALSIASSRKYSSCFLGLAGRTVREESRTIQWKAIALP